MTDDPLAAGRTHAQAHEWGAAAVEFARAASAAGVAGDRVTARQAWEAAGDCWRRDDRPRHAAEALNHCLAATPEGPAAALARVKLAGVLGDLGQTARALELLEGAETLVTQGPLRALVLDTRFEALIGLGRREAAAEVARALGVLVTAEPALQMSASFRAGQVARLEGRLDDAAACFGSVIALVEDHAEALPARAAAEAELAELAALKGDTAESLALWDAARTHFSEVGRRSLDWRAEAGRVRAAVEAGAFVFVGDLDEGVATAEQRGMVSLEADLRIARGVARAGSDRAGARQDLERAIGLADAAGLQWRAGRGRLELARRLAEGSARVDLARRAAKDLVGNDPWHWRAFALAAEGLELARALARFELMGMDRDAELARARMVAE